MKKQALKRTFLDTVPVLTGYVFLGIGFGILLHEKGYGVGWAFCMSLFIYAGAMQYLAVDLLSGGVSLIATAITTLLVNARHLFYGISMLDTYSLNTPYRIFALTDETYSLVSQNKPPEGMTRQQYCLCVSVLDHIYWVCGCVLGSLAGALIPIAFEGVDFVLTALFVTLFVEQWLSTKNHLPAIIGVMSTIACLMLFGSQVFLVPSLVLITILLTLTRKTGRRSEDA